LFISHHHFSAQCEYLFDAMDTLAPSARLTGYSSRYLISVQRLVAFAAVEGIFPGSFTSV
ncbi:hypothetical protein BDR07DRAFT_1401174, partial [Suillus spraguei]